MVIYKTTNLVNGKIYIGKDEKNNPNYLGSGKILKQALEKYDRKNFKKEILETCFNIVYLQEREIYWISFYTSTDKNIGYNITKGGEGGDTISNNPNRDLIRKIHSEKMKNPKFNKNKAKGKKEIVRKKNDVNWVNPIKGRTSKRKGMPSGRKGILSPEHSKWMIENNPMKNKTHSDFSKKKMSESAKGKSKSAEHKKKLSENSPNNKVCNLEGKVFLSVASAAKELGISENTIRGRIKNKNFKNWDYE